MANNGQIMCLTFCMIICLMQIFSFANATEGKYTVIAPGTIHSQNKYTAAVSIHQTSQPCKIRVGITGPSYNETKEVEASHNEVKNVEFDVPFLEKGDYNITAEGVDCLDNFRNTTKLNYAKFSSYIRIQTDKGIYKPGDDINFRVIFLDKDLKPAVPEKNAVIWFEDGKRNRIKEIRDFETIKGVYTDKFAISEYPVTGGWRLGCSNGARFDKIVFFEVNEYVLPKFVVKVEATDSVSVKDGDMQIVVRANYTYGKPLDGKVTVILSITSSYYFDTSRNSESTDKKQPPVIIRNADMVKGKAKIDLNVKEYEPFLPYKNSPSYMGIVATVEEQFTGVKINGTSSSTLYPYRYAMNCVSYDTCSTFEVGKITDVLFQITYVDGTHLNDSKSPVELIYKEVLRKNHWWHREREVENDDDATPVTTITPETENRSLSFTSHMNATGFVNFKVSLPDLPEYEGFSHYYSLELKYLDEQRELYTTYQYREPKKTDITTEKDGKSKEYFMLLDKYSPENKLYVNKVDQFTLNSSQPLSYFDYNVVGRGNILKTGHIDLPDKPKVYNLTLTPEISWAPNFGLYVYYVDEKGEYHYAEQRYYIDFELQNQINVTAAKQVKPGDEVALHIKTTPSSFVGLMAVDQSVLLLKPNNDLNPHEFNWILSAYTTNTPYQGGYSEYPGTTSGCVTLTNADYFYNWTKPDYMSRPFSAADRGFISNDDFNLKTAVQESAAAPAGAAFGSAGSVSDSDIAGDNNIQVRKDFSETWLFTDIENTETEEFTWSKKIPETITSWVLTAFSLNPIKGLGVTKESTEIKTFLPFFISIRLPYSVKRGEVINVPALIFNYLDKALDVDVTLDNSDNEYEFTEFTNEVINEPKRSKSIRVPANGAAGVSFLLKPKIIGNIMLKFTAVSPMAGDAIHKSMKVVPEGITQYANRAYFVNLKNKQEMSTSFKLELPEDLVPDSEHVEVGAIGDILGPVLNNLDNLVRLPTGCGEQTMSSLLPNYLVMKYLQSTQLLKPNMETKLRYNMETGYQNLLKYRHQDGSFSSFGPAQNKDKPRNGSTWLTAYVTRSLQLIKEFINVNQNFIDEGLQYLNKQQAENGSFTEKGDYFYNSQRNHIALTSAAILAFLENDTVSTQYNKELSKGLDFIATNIGKTDSLHAQAVGTYTLNRAKHPAAKESLSKLKSLAKTDSDRMWWSAEKDIVDERWWFFVFSNDVEITSYILLTILDQGNVQVDDVIPIITWLVAQRNSYGGFASTQDTVVGLSALIKFAKYAGYEAAKMNIDIAGANKKETIKLTEDNGILYQTVEMPPDTKEIAFHAQGTGSALVQIAYQYNIFEKDPKPSFTVKLTKLENNNRPSHMEMLVCVNYIGDGEASNMAVLEISTPSGYIIDDESLKPIKELKNVGNTELRNSDSLLAVYFQHLYKDDETCLMVEAYRTHAVALQKPSPIVLYDYYDNNKKVTSFYEVESKLCDICEGEEECKICK